MRPRNRERTALRADSYVEEAARWLPRRARPCGPQLAPASTHPRQRVLVADDNADMRDYVARLLSEHYEVETVPNGAEALERVLDRPPDLVLSDVMMPGLDGFGLLQALRANPATTHLAGDPALGASGRGGACRRAGCRRRRLSGEALYRTRTSGARGRAPGDGARSEAGG